MTETPSPFAGRLALGHFLRFYSRDKEGEYVSLIYSFQNFYFGENKRIGDVDYTLYRLGFRGLPLALAVTLNRQLWCSLTINKDFLVHLSLKPFEGKT